VNLRTLKKLSKRAAPLLTLLGDRREQFPCPNGDGHLSWLITERKHWDRSSCHPSYTPSNSYSTPRGMPLKLTTRAGHPLIIRPPMEPRKGTIMVGGVDGGPQPEWSEETAWEALREQVWWAFVDFHPTTGEIVSTRDFPTPSAVLRGAAEIIAAKAAR